MSQYGNYPNPDLCRKYGCHFEKYKLSIMSCPGCESQQQTINAQQGAVLRKAIAHAKEKKVPVSIYQDPATREYLYVESAYAAGLPVIQTVSPYFEPTA